MSDTILVINAGSSSIKFYLYDIDASHQLAPRLGGQLEGIGTTHPRLRATWSFVPVSTSKARPPSVMSKSTTGISFLEC